MFSYIWPIALVVLSNTVYQICSKSVPQEVNPFAALTITYLVGALFTAVMYFLTGKSHNIVKEMSQMNWAPFLLGVVIVGLEVGFIYAYKAGWQVSMASIVQSAFLAISLVFVGAIMYREAITWNKILGIIICMVGLVFVNLK